MANKNATQRFCPLKLVVIVYGRQFLANGSLHRNLSSIKYALNSHQNKISASQSFNCWIKWGQWTNIIFQYCNDANVKSSFLLSVACTTFNAFKQFLLSYYKYCLVNSVMTVTSNKEQICSRTIQMCNWWQRKGDGQAVKLGWNRKQGSYEVIGTCYIF